MSKHLTARHRGIVGYAECNTSPATTTGQTNIPYDTFYDVDQNPVAFSSLLGLDYNGSDEFEALEDGIWILNLGIDLTVNPGHAGKIFLAVPNYGYAPTILLAAAGNPTEWQVERTVVMRVGDTFRVIQQPTGGGGSGTVFVNGFSVIDIIRIAGAVV